MAGKNKELKPFDVLKVPKKNHKVLEDISHELDSYSAAMDSFAKKSQRKNEQLFALLLEIHPEAVSHNFRYDHKLQEIIIMFPKDHFDKNE